MKNIHTAGKIILLSMVLNLLTIKLSAQEKLYVFYPTTNHAQSIQEKMTNQMPGVIVTAFSRYNDFITKIKAEPADGVITKAVLVKEQLNDYEIILNGKRGENIEERYVILSTDKAFSLESVKNETVIGVIDILGRNGMKTFSKQFFPIEPKLQRVSKVEDLLPMLSFNMAAGVLVEDVFVEYFKSTSQMKFTIISLPVLKNSSIVFATNKNKKAENILTILKENKKEISDLFFIDQWK